MELLVFSLFAAALLVCVIFHISLLFALLANAFSYGAGCLLCLL